MMWLVYGEESGEEMTFYTEEEAREWIADVMRFDKENGLVGEVWYITKEYTRRF